MAVKEKQTGPPCYAALDSRGAAFQSPVAGTIRELGMESEASTDKKADLALRLWEALAVKMIRAGIISTDVTDSIIAREFGRAIEDPGITRILEAMTLRFHDLPDEAPASDQPPEP